MYNKCRPLFPARHRLDNRLQLSIATGRHRPKRCADGRHLRNGPTAGLDDLKRTDARQRVIIRTLGRQRSIVGLARQPPPVGICGRRRAVQSLSVGRFFFFSRPLILKQIMIIKKIIITFIISVLTFRYRYPFLSSH